MEELYLKGNSIEQIGVFVEAKSLKNLKILRASIIDNESNRSIITNMKNNIKNCECEINEQKNDKILQEQLKNRAPTLELSLSVKK